MREGSETGGLILSDFLPDGSADRQNLMVKLRLAVLAGCWLRTLLVVLGQVAVVGIFGHGLVSDSVGYG